jgi:hypothetical protein
MPDINAIKARLQQLSQKNKKLNDIWKPKDEHDIRLVPYPYADGEPFIVRYFHYDLGDIPILCPKLNFGDQCDACDFCDVLKSWRTPDGADKPERERKTDFELFRKIQPRESYFAAMVERGHELEGSHFIRVNPTNYMKLLEICADDENNEGRNDGGGTNVLFSTDSAYDLHVVFKKKGEKGNTKNFDSTEFKEKKKTSKLHEDKKVVQSILASVKNIDEVYARMTSADVKRIFSKFVNGAQPEAKVTDDGKEYNSESSEKVKKGGKSIDEAFSEMLGE